MASISTPDSHHAAAQDLLDFIDAGPSPWHAVAEIRQRLEVHGFAALDEALPWRLSPGARHFVVRGGSSIIAFITGQHKPSESGFHIVGAHTDSPGLRVKPRAVHKAEAMLRIGVEVYGGPILATFTDRDLSLAGRLGVRVGDGVDTRLVRFPHPVCRLPNLAIHMNRGVNEDGLKLNKQSELPLLLGAARDDRPPERVLVDLLAERACCAAEDILGFDLAVHDTQPGGFWGAEQEFIADSQLDNLASCHAALTALTTSREGSAMTRVVALFDHEEIGSESAQGADGSLLGDVLERIMLAQDDDREGYMRALARSLMISADMAHAYQPNFPSAYEPQHTVRVNQGPVLKINANQRYATDGLGAARFAALCQRAGVPYQTYSHRTDLACGSTIGPVSAARLGIPTIDIGNPMWAMHSIRESAGVLDHSYMIRLLREFYAD